MECTKVAFRLTFNFELKKLLKSPPGVATNKKLERVTDVGV